MALSDLNVLEDVRDWFTLLNLTSFTGSTPEDSPVIVTPRGATGLVLMHRGAPAPPGYHTRMEIHDDVDGFDRFSEYIRFRTIDTTLVRMSYVFTYGFRQTPANIVSAGFRASRAASSGNKGVIELNVGLSFPTKITRIENWGTNDVNLYTRAGESNTLIESGITNVVENDFGNPFRKNDYQGQAQTGLRADASAVPNGPRLAAGTAREAPIFLDSHSLIGAIGTTANQAIDVSFELEQDVYDITVVSLPHVWRLTAHNNESSETHPAIRVFGKFLFA